MDAKARVNGLNSFLSEVFGEETRLSTLLAEHGFRQEQLDMLRERFLDPLVVAFVDLIRTTLADTVSDGDHFSVFSHRYGFDGEPESSDSSAGEPLGLDSDESRRMLDAALRRCRQKTFQAVLIKGLHSIAIDLLESAGERPPAPQVAAALHTLSELRSAVEEARQRYEDERQEILTAVQPRLDALDAKHMPVLEAHDREIVRLEAEIKNDVLLLGATVQGPGLRAVYTRGRVTWDGKGLQRYAQEHPEVLDYRKVGHPIVMIRSTKSERQDTES